MFRHVVMVKFQEGTTAEQRQAVCVALGRLPEVIYEIRAYRFGDDAGLGTGNYDFVVTADFDDAGGFLAYRDHPEHKKFVADLFAPMVAARAAVQFEWTAALPADLPD